MILKNLPLKKKLTVGPIALTVLAGLASVASPAYAQRRATDYQYTDRAELRACVSNQAATFTRALIPFGGKLCNGRVQPFISGRALLTMNAGDACSFKSETGATVAGTLYSCPGNDSLVENTAFNGLFGGSILTALGIQQMGSATALVQPASSAQIQSALTSVLGPQQSNPEAQELVDSFVTTLLEQHPQLLQYPAAYPMTTIRAAMTNAAKAYRGWLAKNQLLQAKPNGKLSDEVLKRAFAGQFDPANQKKIARGNVLIIFDLTKPDTERRFYVITLKTSNPKNLYLTERHFALHGVGSGKGPFAEQVSNRDDSNMTPFGFHVTGVYKWSDGMNRYRIDLIGLEDLNDMTQKRAILIHPVAMKKINEDRNIVDGNTHGCAGLGADVFERLAPTLKDGNLVLFYHKKLEKTYADIRNKEIFKDLIKRSGYAAR